jgi:ankyrin repeat protein
MEKRFKEACKYVSSGFTDELERLIVKHPDLVRYESREDDKTLLHKSVHLGRIEICNTLLRTGADVNARDRYGWTPLWYTACQCGNDRSDIVDLLVLYGADVDFTNGEGVTTLMECCASGKRLVAESLIKNGANVNLRSNNRVSCLYRTIVWDDNKTNFWLLLKNGAEIESDTEVLKLDLNHHVVHNLALLRVRIAVCSVKIAVRLGYKSKLCLLSTDLIRKLMCEFIEDIKI